MLIRQNKVHGSTCDEVPHISTDVQSISQPPLPMVTSKKSPCLGLKEIYFEFCANTSIHGFQYFGQRRPWKEIFFWLCIFLVSIYFCSSIIVKIYRKWDDTPVIVSFAEKSTPIWNIPFPAVTICPETKRTRNASDPSYQELLVKLNRFIEDGQTFSSNFTAVQLQDTLALMQICEIVGFVPLPALTLPTIDYLENLNRMLPYFDEHFSDCRWFGNVTGCEKLFTKIYTDEGICYTFNSLNASDLYREETVQHQASLERANNSAPSTKKRSLRWSLEQGYGLDKDLHTYPARVLSSGSSAGLVLGLQTVEDDVDYTCQYVADGYKILLHSPDDVPLLSKHFLRIAMDKQMLIAVTPKMITTSADIAAYQPHKRQCFMNRDRQLAFFKVYSQNNCERECLTNFTLAQCGCVKFSMPRTVDMPVCGHDKIACYRRASEQLLLNQFSEALSDGDATECNCMPSCTSLEYETEISEGIFNLATTISAFVNLGEYNEYNETYADAKMSILMIYFKENQFITSRRSELYGLTELVANFGGVCGLFMGISILSFVEMLYHCTLRLWSNMTRVRGVV